MSRASKRLHRALEVYQARDTRRTERELGDFQSIDACVQRGRAGFAAAAALPPEYLGAQAARARVRGYEFLAEWPRSIAPAHMDITRQEAEQLFSEDETQIDAARATIAQRYCLDVGAVIMALNVCVGRGGASVEGEPWE